MNRSFQKSSERENRSGMRAFVRNSNAEQLSQLLRNSICKPDATKVLDDLLQAFSGSDSDSEDSQVKRRKLIESTLKTLGKSKISVGQATAIVNRIIADFPAHSKQHLVKLVDFCLASIRSNDDQLHSWKDLLPVLLESLENEKYIVHADGEHSGIEYKSLIIKTICEYQWDVELLPSLANMFGDIALNKMDRDKVSRTLCNALSNLPLDQAPSFTYQALKLCKERDALKLFDALAKYFELRYSETVSSNSKDSSEAIGTVNVKDVQDIESTVLYHVYQAAQLNHETMKDFIRFVRHACHACEYTLQPFMLSVLMSVSGIYEDQIFEISRFGIVNSSFEREKRRSSAWLRKLLPEPSDIIRIVRRVIDSSNKDRHLVLKGLTGLAFTLMGVDPKSKGNATASWNVGSEMIQEILKRRHETVPVVLQELIDKIIAGGDRPIAHYTDRLRHMCCELSMIVLDHQVSVMTILERLLFLPSKVANQVLNAILPLMRVSPNIRENLLLTLRKALYRKGVSKRQVAVTGFLHMLKYSKMHSWASYRLGISQRCNSNSFASVSISTFTQVTLESDSQRERSLPECDKTLCYEILDILKKSFTYEFQVRLHLYEGLPNVVGKNPDITEVLLDMLISQLNLYLDKDDGALLPVKFELCADTDGAEVVLREPIAHLIFVLQKIYINAAAKNSSSGCEKLRDTLEWLCSNMVTIEPEQFNLEAGGTDAYHFGKPQKKLTNVGMSIGICEALMAFRIGEWSKGKKEESLRKVNDLFEAYARLLDLVKTQSVKVKKLERGKGKKDKDASSAAIRKLIKPSNVKPPDTVMDLDTIRESLSLLLSEWRSGSVSVERGERLRRYAVQTCEQLLQRETSLTNTNDSCESQEKRYASTYVEIGRLLYKYFIVNLDDALTDDEQATVSALRCFKEISCSLCTSLSAELPNFLNSIFEAQPKKNSPSKYVDRQLEEMVLSLVTRLKAVLIAQPETNHEQSNKLPFLLLQLIERFAYKINFEHYNSDKILESTRKLIEIESIESSLAAAIVQFFLHLEERTREYGETLNEICLQLCEKLGSIDGNEIGGNGQYKVIREDSSVEIYSALNGLLKEKLDNVCWLVKRLKAEDAIARAPGTIDQHRSDNLKEKERNLCKELSRVAQVLHTLANVSIASIPSTDATFKNLQYFYHLLGNVTKYFYAKSDGQNAAFQTVKFVQVVKLAGKPLKSAFYNLVTYVEENQNKLDSKSDSFAQRNKILRETKVIPRVVYEIEQFNKEILLLGKRTGVPLENYMKHSVTRDFRIKNPQLVEGLEKMDISMLVSPNLEASDGKTNDSIAAVAASDSGSETEASSSKRVRMDDRSVLD